MSSRTEDEVVKLMAKAKPSEIKRMASLAMEMLMAQRRMAQNRNAGLRFAASSADRDAQIARANMGELLETLQGRPDCALKEEGDE